MQRKTNIQPANLATLEVSLNADAEFSREVVGGKGMSLKRMQDAGIPVPEFSCISLPIINQIEGQLISIELLKPYIANIEEINLQTPSIANIKDWINNLPENTKRQALQGLYEFIQSDDFYQLIQHTAPADYIRQTADQLTLDANNSQAIMVRSSGIYEDNYGDAQAGKYHSKVNNHADIVKSFLEVYASSFAPGVCQLQGPQPLAVILQKCVNCSKGGVVMSYSSLTDDTMRVEYAQGQPCGAVAGQNGICPHHYDLVRAEDGFNASFTLGKVDSQFVLLAHDNADTFTEAEQPVTATRKNSQLTDKQLENLYRYIKKLEAMFLCPVDVEFAINKQGKLYILQVRPITCLAGGVNFAIDAPENTEISGIATSEGFCYGKPILVNSPADADNIPQGAIIYAESADDWMLEPNFLAKVGGFVLKYGGTADHTAISLRQAQIPCVIAADSFKLPDNPTQELTLVAGNFNGRSAGFVVAEDITTKLQATMTTAIDSTAIQASIREPQAIEFTTVDAGFQWLNSQNTRLLNYFANGGLVSKYLSAQGLVQLSMQANRSKILEQLTLEINNLFADAEDFIAGFQRFIALAGNEDAINKNVNLDTQAKDKLIAKIKASELLITKLQQLKDKLNLQLNNINEQLIASNTKSTMSTSFNNWLTTALSIGENLQELSLPKSPTEVTSVHDFIFWLHKEFIDALNEVVLASNQGQIIKLNDETVLIDFSSAQAEDLLNYDCLRAIYNISSNNKVIVLDDIVIVNAQLGHHACVIELLEHAEAGKNRTLRLQLSDNFMETANYQGKLKRFWFLQQLLKNISLDENSTKIQVEVNQVSEILKVQCTQIKTKKDLRLAFLKLASSLLSIVNLDMLLNNVMLFEDVLFWDFPTLTKIFTSFTAEQNKNAFQFILFFFGYSLKSKLEYINAEDQYIINLARKLASASKVEEIQQLLATIPIEIYQPIIYYFLVIDPKKAYRYASQGDFLQDPGAVVKLLIQNPRIFEYVDDKYADDEQLVYQAVKANAGALGYASTRLRNNRKIVLAAVTKAGVALQHADAELKNDRFIVLAAIKNYGGSLKYASEDLQNDIDIVSAATNEDPCALEYASAELRNSKEIVLSAVFWSNKTGHFIER